LLIKAILSRKTGGLRPEDFRAIESTVALPRMEPIEVPVRSERVMKEWFDDTAPNDVLAFLGLENADRAIVDQWLVNRTALSTWSESLQVSKAMRNTTAHGALSASKVKDWKLQGTIQALTRNAGRVAAAVLQKLCE